MKLKKTCHGCRALNLTDMKTEQLKTKAADLKSGDRVHVLGEGMGVVCGRVGYPTPNLIRIEFDSGNVLDYLPSKLDKKGLLPE